jgi:hypothetical protein
MSVRLNLILPFLLLPCLAQGSGKTVAEDKKSHSFNIVFDAGFGAAHLGQQLPNDDSKAGFGLSLGLAVTFGLGDLQASHYHLGIGYLAAGIDKRTGSGINEVETSDSLQLIPLKIGYTPTRWLRIDGGYGLALFKHTDKSTQSTTENSTTNSATGRGWTVGVALLPVQAGILRIGFVANYFDAWATKYSSDAVNSGVGIKSDVSGRVHASGWYGGISAFLGL